jgi:hypothetical protein
VGFLWVTDELIRYGRMCSYADVTEAEYAHILIYLAESADPKLTVAESGYILM